MKISKEKFDKLNQLDRIEFRQRYQSINNQKKSMSNFIYYALILSFLSIACGLIAQVGGFNEVSKTFFELSNNIIVVGIFFFIIDFMMVLSSLIKASKKLKDLESEYFKVEIKKRSSK